MHDLYKVSAILFYALGAMAFLAHIVGFMKNWMKIKEMRQKSRDKLKKSVTPMAAIRRRLKQAKRDTLRNKR